MDWDFLNKIAIISGIMGIPTLLFFYGNFIKKTLIKIKILSIDVFIKIEIYFSYYFLGYEEKVLYLNLSSNLQVGNNLYKKGVYFIPPDDLFSAENNKFLGEWYEKAIGIFYEIENISNMNLGISNDLIFEKGKKMIFIKDNIPSLRFEKKWIKIIKKYKSK